jgi:hypothetical protein
VVSGDQGRFGVRITYVEPEFQRRNPDSPPEFSFTWVEVPAASAEEAARLVRLRWEDMARWSRVGWRREIRTLTAFETGAGDPGSPAGEPF